MYYKVDPQLSDPHLCRPFWFFKIDLNVLLLECLMKNCAKGVFCITVFELLTCMNNFSYPNDFYNEISYLKDLSKHEMTKYIEDWVTRVYCIDSLLRKVSCLPTVMFFIPW